MRHRTDFHRRSAEINAVVEQAIDHRAKRGAQIFLGNMPEIEISTAVRRASTGFDLFQDCIRRNISRRIVLPKVGASLAIDEFFELAVQQLAAELVAKRVPHNGIHPDESRCEMPNGKKLNELHIDELSVRP